MPALAVLGLLGTAAATLFAEIGGEVSLPAELKYCQACSAGSSNDCRTLDVVPRNASHSACLVPPSAHVDTSFAVLGSADGWSYDLVGRALPMLQAALTKRPYREGDKGGLLLAVAAAVKQPVVRLLLKEPEEKEILTVKDVGPDVSLHEFDLKDLPEDTDLVVEVSGGTDGAKATNHAERVLRLVRVPAPAAGSFSQVDFTRRGLLMNDDPFVVLGLYAGDSNYKHVDPNKWNDTYTKGPNEVEKILKEIDLYAEHGLTSLMLYHFYEFPEDQQQILLDRCAYRKVFLMYPVHMLMRDVVGGNKDAWEKVAKIVTRWKDHPGLLGWYVCDDCTTTYIKAQQAAKTDKVDVHYEKFKALDPYHVVIGAVESTELDVFTQPSEYTDGVSLDVLMYEQYISRPAHDHSTDLRLGGLAFAPMVNCPGPFQLSPKHDPNPLAMRSQADIVYSLSWLSMIKARIPHQLYFRRKFVTDEHLDAIARYSKEVRETFARFTLAPEPYTEMPVAVSDNFRAALLPDGACAMLVVTETAGAPGSSFVATFAAPATKAATPFLAGTGFFGTTDIPVTRPPEGGQQLTDTLNAFETKQYRLGDCAPLGAGRGAQQAPPQPLQKAPELKPQKEAEATKAKAKATGEAPKTPVVPVPEGQKIQPVPVVTEVPDVPPVIQDIQDGPLSDRLLRLAGCSTVAFAVLTFFFLAAQSACTGLKSGEKQPLLAQMRADAATSPKLPELPLPNAKRGRRKERRADPTPPRADPESRDVLGALPASVDEVGSPAPELPGGWYGEDGVTPERTPAGLLPENCTQYNLYTPRRPSKD